jgi:hypothetical protein
METINNMAAAATKAVWGTLESKSTIEPTRQDHSNAGVMGVPQPEMTGQTSEIGQATRDELKKDAEQEPLSGVTGDTSKGEPYDAGNLKNPFASSGGPAKQEPLSGVTGDTFKGQPYDAGNFSNPLISSEEGTKHEPTSGEAGAFQGEQAGAHSDNSPLVSSGNDTKQQPLSGAIGGVSDGHPSHPESTALASTPLSSRDETVGKQPPTSQQNVGHPKPEAALVNDEPKAPINPSVTEAGDKLGGGEQLNNPDKHLGPRSTEEVAQTRGGDAGNTQATTAGQKEKEQMSDSEGLQSKLGDKRLDSKESENKGIGTKHVESTGLYADGGDFDVTKPGAGAEADRLREHKEEAGDGDDKGHSGKPSLGHRIKAKFKH